jgi:hypothetical protein
MVSHRFLQPGDQEGKLNLLAIHGSIPTVGNGHVIQIDRGVTEHISFPDQRPYDAISHRACSHSKYASGIKNIVPKTPECA